MQLLAGSVIFYGVISCGFIYNWNFMNLVWVFILMQFEGTDLSALTPSASVDAIDLISVSGYYRELW